MGKKQLKDTIVFCKSWHETMKASLTPEQYVETMEVLITYYENGYVFRKTGDPLIDTIAMMCQHTLDENGKRYFKKIENAEKNKEKN